MHRMMKLLALCIVAFLLCGVVCGCGNTGDQGEKVTVVSKDQKSAETVSVSFIEALAAGDYETAVSLTEAYSEDGFVFASDIEWYLPRSSFANIQNLGFEAFKTKAEGKASGDSAEYTVTLVDASVEPGGVPAERSFIVTSVLNDDNVWVVSVPEFYCTDFLFRTTGGNTKVFIEGREVSDELCSDDKAGPSELCKEYIIPFIGKNDVEVLLKSDNFEYTQKITPNSNNSISSSVSVFVPVEEPDKCFSYVKDTWNALCAKYLVGEKASCVQDYIAKNASYDLCNTVWDGFEEIHVGDSSNGGFKNEKYNLTVCKSSSKGDVYWISDTQVMCYFDYELTWYYTFGKENQSTHQNSSVVLSVENGVYKFYDFPDTGLFFEANNYSNEW